ncbi:MAG TPA: GNAT family N-acetyltransferase [Acidimicrobiales bacterium]|nr:GNAT family N-acetyltransferase [Acidimicrobiales bacterium]
MIRLAGPADAAELAEVERRTAMGFGGTELVIDRGDDWFAPYRLMGDAEVMVAEVDGAIVGLVAGALHPANVGGVPRRMLYIHHARILPAHQGRGIAFRLSSALFESFRERGYDSTYWYIAPDNAKSQAFARRAPNRWSCGPELATIGTDLAGPAHGRPAEPADAAALAELINVTHSGSEMFHPYTAASLAERLTRDPTQYTWADVLVGDGAAVGVRSTGQRLVFREAGRTVHDATEGLILDIACAPGAQRELERLLRAAVTRANHAGIEDLSVFTHPASPTRAVLVGLHDDVMAFDMWTPTLEEPPDAAAHGVHVDPVYF